MNGLPDLPCPTCDKPIGTNHRACRVCATTRRLCVPIHRERGYSLSEFDKILKGMYLTNVQKSLAAESVLFSRLDALYSKGESSNPGRARPHGRGETSETIVVRVPRRYTTMSAKP